ncbi:MAG: Esterase, depolymerase [Ramlibacter sp.]|nr:Esterase, depolymerase [Ramlibacter sp.]
MNPLFQRLMQSAARLTHRGDLKAATAVIQAALGGKPDMPPARHEPQDEVIDVVAREIAAPVQQPLPDPLPQADPQPQSQPARPAKGRFVAGSYAETAGQRDYKLYIPPGAGERPMPLVVMLHGCTQGADDFAAGTAMNELARAQGFFVLYPEQSQQANPQRCWNWFKHSHQQRGRGEPALLAGMTREVMQGQSIDAARVYVAGLSAGGAMAAILGDAYPDLYAAVGVHSGLATGAAKDLPSAFGAMRSGPQIVVPAAASGIPTIVFHGDADSTVHPGNGGHVIAASVHKEADVEAAQGVAAGGRHYTRELHRAPGGGPVVAEHWVVHGAPHAWSGGSAKGSYTDPQGPDASAEMVRFFLGQLLRPVH